MTEKSQETLKTLSGIKIEKRFGGFFSFVFLLDRFIPSGVTGRAHVKAGPPRDGSPVRCRALCEHLWVQYLAQGYLGSALKVFWESYC